MRSLQEQSARAAPAQAEVARAVQAAKEEGLRQGAAAAHERFLLLADQRVRTALDAAAAGQAREASLMSLFSPFC